MNTKKVLKITKKTILWILGIWFGILLILQIIMLPPIFTPLANTLANEFVNADVHIGHASGSVLSRFPRISVSFEDLQITYPHERFDSLSRTVAQNDLIYYGCGEKSDTLASIRRLSASISLVPLLWGEIKLPDIEVHSPTIYAHSYDSKHANWDIFGSAPTSEKPDTTKSEKTTSSSSSKSSSDDEGMNIILKKIRITGRPKIVYTDSQDSLFVLVNMKNISFDGHFETAALHKLMAEAYINNVHINGKFGSDTLAGQINTVSLKPHNGHMDMNIVAQAYPPMSKEQLLPVPIDISGELSIPKDEGIAVKLDSMKTCIGTIPGKGHFDVKMRSDSTVIDGKFTINYHNLQDFINSYGSLFLPGAENATSNTTLYVDATVNGAINNASGTLPEVSVIVDIPDSHIDHESFPKKIDLGLYAKVRMDKYGMLHTNIDRSKIFTYGLNLNTKTQTVPQEDDNHEITISNGTLNLYLDSLSRFLPESMNIIADGHLNVNLDGTIKLSDFDIYKFSNAGLKGSFVSDNLIFVMPEDSINVKMSAVNINLGPEVQKVRRNTMQLMSIKGSMAHVDVNISDALTFKGDSIEFTASNAINEEDVNEEESKVIKYVGGTFIAKSLYLMDSDSTCIKLTESRNRFGMYPNPMDNTIPVLSISDSCSKISYLTSDNLVILKAPAISALAVMKPTEQGNQTEQAKSADKMGMRGKRRRNGKRKDDFRSQDFRFNINDVAKQYFKEWEMFGKISAEMGIVRGTQSPFTNIIDGIRFTYKSVDIPERRGLKMAGPMKSKRAPDTLRIDTLRIDFMKNDCMKIDDNMVDWKNIDSTKKVSGRLEIISEKARIASITGIKRALIHNAPVMIEMTVRSPFFNADELLSEDFISSQSTSQESIPETTSEQERPNDLTTEASGSSAPSSSIIVIPRNIQTKINIDLDSIRYKGTDISKIKTQINIKDRCAQIIGTEFRSDVGNAYLDAFYASRSKKDIKCGFCLDLVDITSERIIALMPEIGDVIPTLNAIKGKLNCEVAATADLDTTMSLMMPTVNGIARLKGSELGISNDKTYTEVARKLLFKNKKEGHIDSLMIEAAIKDNKLEVFPFILNVDKRYKLGLGGVQNMDMSYQHHISVLKSPLLIRFGMNLSGPDYNHMKFKLGKAKYKEGKLESFTEAINDTKTELKSSIENIFKTGVEKTIKTRDQHKHIRMRKEQIGYFNAATQEMEELDSNELKRVEEIANAEKAMEDATAEIVAAVKKVLKIN